MINSPPYKYLQHAMQIDYAGTYYGISARSNIHESCTT